MGERTSITSGLLTADIAHHGAELQSLIDIQGHQLMSAGDPTFWRGRAPLLFPIVGRLNEDKLRLGDAVYPMKQHGFARKSDFALIEASESEALFRLSDTAETRAQYPFAFELDVCFQLNETTLHKRVIVRNTGNEGLPFSFGYHPAFAWPLPFGGARSAHQVSFGQDEPASLCRVTSYGTIGSEQVPTPIVGNRLPLADDLFANDALVWRDLNSRSVTYGAPGFPTLDITFPDTPWLGIWTNPGAAFVCVEPWAGMADPEGYQGDFADKPGIMKLAPGEERSFRMDVTLTA
ncbi:MAG: aldose 1-epimerase family protein [Sphingorhabdus sp.]